MGYTLWWTYKKLLKMAIEIVDFPIKIDWIDLREKLQETMDFPIRYGAFL